MLPVLLWGVVLALAGAAAARPADDNQMDGDGPRNSVLRMDAGGDATCAVTQGGAVYCWGKSDDQLLGRRPVAARPAKIPGLSKIQDVAVGGRHACAMDRRGVVSCWGSTELGRAGQVRGGARPQPVPSLQGRPSSSREDRLGRTVLAMAIDAGFGTTCIIAQRVDVEDSETFPMCWGKFRGDESTVSVPERVDGVTNEVTAIAAGAWHGCVVARGTLHCWGANNHGQLGTGNNTPSRNAVPVPGLTQVRDVEAYDDTTCAIHGPNREVSCWGVNDRGQTGSGRAGPDVTRPALVPGLRQVERIAVGRSHVCATTSTAPGLVCWGSRARGQLGDGQVADAIAGPTPVPGIEATLTSIVAGQSHTCAFTGGLDISCWGANEVSQLGAGSPDPIRPTPTPIPLTGRAR